VNSKFNFTHHSIGIADRLVTVGELVFNDEASRNSFRLETSRELFKMLPQIEKTCDALIFRSAGRVFCSGGNLKDHAAQGAVKSKLANREITKCLSRLSSLSIPTIAVVEGDALGGGVELLSAFDVVLSVPHAVFGLWQRRLGLSFGWGGGARLVRLSSAGRISRAALESRPMNCYEAQTMGIVDQIVSSWSARTDGIALALRLASLPKSSVPAMKNLRAVPPAEARREQVLFEKLWFGPAHKIKLSSGKTKRS
jgi:enoyl-CoA hydratase/carnithine racemase